MTDATISEKPDYYESMGLEELHALAEKGDVPALFELGERHCYGADGVPINHTEAVRWYSAAAEKNHPEATYELSSLYLTGMVGAVDNSKGVELLQQAARLDHQEAMRDLGFTYAKGWNGVTPNNAEAIKYLLMAVYKDPEDEPSAECLMEVCEKVLMAGEQPAIDLAVTNLESHQLFKLLSATATNNISIRLDPAPPAVVISAKGFNSVISIRCG
jgi:hypothetical protein